jgi:integrase/recombinase XerD
MFFSEAVQELMEEQEYKGNSPATLTYYRDRLRMFQESSRAYTLEDFNERSIRRWLMGYKNAARNSLVNYDRGLRVFANWLHRRGYLQTNPMAALPKPKEVATHITIFTPQDVKALLEEVKVRKHPLRDAALLILLLDTGIRVGEAANLHLKDIHWSEGWMSVNGKSGERSVPFGRKAKLALRKYIDRERTAASSRITSVFLTGQGELFTSQHMTQQVIRLVKAAKIKVAKSGLHTFRHTFSVEFIRAGGDAFTLQRILGHSTLDMTRKYVHLAKTDLRSAHRTHATSVRASSTAKPWKGVCSTAGGLSRQVFICPSKWINSIFSISMVSVLVEQQGK